MKQVLLSLFAFTVVIFSSQGVKAADAASGPQPEWRCDGVVINKMGVSGPTGTAPIDFVAVGAPAYYVINVSNYGRCDLTHLKVVDFLPRGVNFVSSLTAPDWSSEHKVVWDEISLAPGASVSFEVTADVVRQEGRMISNQACVSNRNIAQVCSSFNSGFNSQAAQ